MTASEGALQGALHDRSPIGGGPRAGDARAPARPILASVTNLTDRSRHQVAERWGKPVEEPAADAPAEGEKTRLRDGLNSVHLYRDPLPSQHAVKADYADGLERARELGWYAVWAYRAFGWPARALNLLASVLHTATQRPGRFAALLGITVIALVALAIAGAL